MVDDDELKHTVTTWLKRQLVDIFNDSVNKLEPHLNKWLDLNADYVEKWSNGVVYNFIYQ